MDSSEGQPGHPFAGPGEVRSFARAMDWAATPLGPVDGWTPALRNVVRTCLESPFPINLWCGSELVLIYNDAYRAVLGAKHPHALGRPGSEVWAEIWPEIEPMFEQIRAGGPPVYANDAPFIVERTGEGSAQEAPGEPNAWFTFSLSPVRDEAGEIVAFLNIVSESTGRLLAERAREAARERAERAEARLLDMFAQAPAFMAVVRGSDFVFEYANRAYYQLVGQRDLIGLPVSEAIPEARSQGFEELLANVIRTGEPYVGREVPILFVRSPGSAPEQRFLDFVYYPITEADGTRSGVVAHGYDVTEHVRARREAQRARAEAEEANQSKSQFLANMSHEIRTPINAIIGYTSLLELGVSGPLTDDQKSQLERVRASSEHLLMLIDDVLDLARVEAGRLEVEQEHVLAAETVNAAIALVGPQAAEREIRLEHECPPESGLSYMGDPDRVRQILANLLSNAIKFTPGGGEVRITCGTAEPGEADAPATLSGRLTYFRVSDTGIGIKPADLEKIFHPFMQVERGHTRTKGGTGLGLTISRHLAVLMGGDLTAASRPGEGSTFTLWLRSPAGREAGAPAAVETPPQVEEPTPRELMGAGEALRRQLPLVLESVVERIQRDPAIPMAAELTRAELVNHGSTLLSEMVQSLMLVETAGEGAEDAPDQELEVQRLLAELHGRQRARHGWTAAALEREWQILREEVENAVRKVLPGGAESSAALAMPLRFLERAERISRSAIPGEDG